MQRIALSVVISLFAFNTAFAGPLNLNPQSPANAGPVPPPSRIGAIFSAPSAPEPAAPRTVAAEGPNFGGGLIEMLFRPPGGQQYAPRVYQQEPQFLPGFGPRQRPEDPDMSDPSAPDVHSRTVAPKFMKQEVSYDGKERPGTVIINTRERHLYLVQDNGRALRYGIGVGRPGFTWAGAHSITQMREWPDWRPPAEMLRRQPHLPRHMQGGPDNPLGARAMYLGSTLYRIHGSNEPWTIGQAVSSGCIRMRNEDVIDLYGRVRVGTRVVVI
jgi:lipoprotein-anchoring transpeptidase ErfK/SrfK